MSHSRATNSRSFLSCYLFCSLSSTDPSQAPEWSHMDSTSSVWQLCGHHLACVIIPSPPSSQFSVFLSSPTAAAAAPKVHVPRVCLIHITNLTYLPHTLHRGLVVRFAIRPDLKFGPHPSFRSSSASVSYSANPAIISYTRASPSHAQSSPRTQQSTGESVNYRLQT